jgi:hypothetical protein
VVSQYGTQFSQACFYLGGWSIDGNLAFDKAKICQLCPCPKVDLIAEDGISKVGKMSCFGSVHKNGVLYLGDMPYNAISANQAIAPDIGTMADFSLVADYGGRFN